jgi:hypothetical protein
MFKFYGNMLEKNPILTKSTTNGIIMSIADYITQTGKNLLMKYSKSNLLISSEI